MSEQMTYDERVEITARAVLECEANGETISVATVSKYLPEGFGLTGMDLPLSVTAAHTTYAPKDDVETLAAPEEAADMRARRSQLALTIVELQIAQRIASRKLFNANTDVFNATCKFTAALPRVTDAQMRKEWTQEQSRNRANPNADRPKYEGPYNSVLDQTKFFQKYGGGVRRTGFQRGAEAYPVSMKGGFNHDPRRGPVYKAPQPPEGTDDGSAQ
jgi:hypothetical protein